jgi:transcription elongation factor GreB
MGRYRAPRPKGSNYITPEGERALRLELQTLWQKERPSVTAAVHEAAKNGDRSENGDYIYGKKRLREIDSRVRFLTKRLEQIKVVDALPDNRQTAYFGAWVTVLDHSGKQFTVRIVGPDEFDLAMHKISMDSPLAKALIGKQIDDEVAYQSPAGLQQMVIVDVRYEPPIS